MKCIFENDDFVRALPSFCAPLARELDGGLDGLGARVHRQRHLEARERAELAQERPHAIVVHGARRQRHALRLLDERRDELTTHAGAGSQLSLCPPGRLSSASDPVTEHARILER